MIDVDQRAVDRTNADSVEEEDKSIVRGVLGEFLGSEDNLENEVRNVRQHVKGDVDLGDIEVVARACDRQQERILLRGGSDAVGGCVRGGRICARAVIGHVTRADDETIRGQAVCIWR